MADGALPARDSQPYNDEKNSSKEGTAFFQREWAKGSVLTPDRLFFRDIYLKIDLLHNLVLYRDSTGRVLAITVPLKEVWIDQPRKGVRAHFIDGHMLPKPRTGLYQLLIDDEVSLVKGIRKYFEQYIPYGLGAQYRIKTDETYFVYFDYQEFIVSKPSEFLRIFPSRKAALKQHLEQLDKKLSKEEQLLSMVAFCNTLEDLTH